MRLLCNPIPGTFQWEVLVPDGLRYPKALRQVDVLRFELNRRLVGRAMGSLQWFSRPRGFLGERLSPLVRALPPIMGSRRVFGGFGTVPASRTLSDPFLVGRVPLLK